MIAYHKALITALRTKLQYVGIRIEEKEASLLYAGRQLFSPTTESHRVSMDYAEELFRDRHALMKDWEEAHPGEKPFPDIFAEVVLAKLRAIDMDDPADTIIELIKLAETELS